MSRNKTRSRNSNNNNNDDNNKMAPSGGQEAAHDNSLATTTSTTPQQEEESEEKVENINRGGLHVPLGGFFRTVVETPKNVVHGLASPFFSSKQRDQSIKNNNDERTPLSVSFASHQIEQVEVDTEAPPASSSSSIITTTTPGDCNAAKAKWRGLAKKVDQGEFLLHHPTESRSSSSSSKSTEEKRKEAEQQIRSGLEFSLTQCVVAILLYIAIAVIAFSFVFDHWSIIDSCYFAVVTFTTIGYGDLVPDTKPGRVFTCFFALSGVACLGIALGVVGSNVMEAEQLAINNAKSISQQQVLYLFGGGKEDQTARSSSNSSSRSHRQISSSSSSGGGQQMTEESTAIGFCHGAWTYLRDFLLVFLVLLIFASFVANDPGIDGVKYDFGDTLYFAIITASTVGYGDMAPKTQHARLLAVLFIPLAVGAMGNWLSSVASWIIHRRQVAFKKKLDTHEFSLDDLEIMDEDGDGEVTRAEFLEFMLLAMNKVDRELIDELRARFARMDESGRGVLSKDTLIDAAKRKLRSPARKLQLSMYKQQLLQESERQN